jgi:hypothetical protein
MPKTHIPYKTVVRTSNLEDKVTQRKEELIYKMDFLTVAKRVGEGYRVTPRKMDIL